MKCQGEGAPTVLLISGYPDRGDASWETSLPGNKESAVFSGVSKFTKVCDYDRPGTVKIIGNQILKSRSDSVQQPVTAENQVSDLHNLVKAAEINNPIIIVAHSAGGLIARLYAMTYPNDVSGLILIDVTNEKLLKTWTKKELDVFHFSVKNGSKELGSLYKNLEVINFDESFKQLDHYQDQKLHIAAIVLTAGEVPNAGQLVKNGVWPSFVTQKMAESIIKGVYRASDLVADSFVPTATRIDVKKSGHYIQKEQPGLIIELIRSMVEQQK
jgi:pimeloyl-ACP methyl ester carboxylesterase